MVFIMLLPPDCPAPLTVRYTQTGSLMPATKVTHVRASALPPVAVEPDGADDDQSLDDVLPDVGDPDQDQSVGEDRDDQRADQRAPDRTDAADEAGAAEDDRGDGVELVGLAELQPVGRIEPGRRHHAAEAGERPETP